MTSPAKKTLSIQHFLRFLLLHKYIYKRTVYICLDKLLNSLSDTLFILSPVLGEGFDQKNIHIENTDEELLKLLETDRDKAIELLFRQYYSLVTYAVYRVLPDRSVAEDLAQEVFFDLWRKREKLNITTSLKAYLRRAAVNRTLNHIRDKKMNFEDEEKIPELRSKAATIFQKLEAEELQKKINEAVDSLPERCRAVFSLSRFEEMSYKEIAAKLDISVKTVENQISKALSIMRTALGPFK